jgi:hypothetical protein
VTETDIKASYQDGVLEVRIPYPDARPVIKVRWPRARCRARLAPEQTGTITTICVETLAQPESVSATVLHTSTIVEW